MLWYSDSESLIYVTGIGSFLWDFYFKISICRVCDTRGSKNTAYYALSTENSTLAGYLCVLHNIFLETDSSLDH